MENNKEIQGSTKDFLKSVFNYFKFIGSKWRLLLIALLIGTSYDLIVAKFNKKDKEYFGKIIFNLELDGSGSTSALGGLAANFGLGGGGGGGASLLSSSNFESVVLSLNVFQNAFMREVKVGNKKDLFINYFIDSSNIKQKEWAGGIFKSPSPYSTFRFKKKSINEFTPNENLIITEIYNKLLGTTDVKKVEKTSLIQITSSTSNEMLTKVWIETLMDATEEFYKNMKTKKSRLLLVLQERRLDSLAYLLKHNDSRLARATFDNPLVVDPGGILKQQTTQRDNGYLSTQYYTQLTNVENLNRMVFEQTPIFTVLEPVRLPLFTEEKVGLSQRLGGIICLFAMIIILTLIDTYKKIMSE